MTDSSGRMMSLEGYEMFCPFTYDTSRCGKWCPMLGREGGEYYCTRSVTRIGCGQLMKEDGDDR